MTDTAIALDDVPKAGLKWPLILGVILSLAGAAGGYYAAYSGLILPTQAASTNTANPDGVKPGWANVAYVPVEPIIISLPATSSAKHLRFSAQLEVAAQHQAEVIRILPRVVDVLNSYLRALEPSDIEAPDALIHMRAQMLRRIQIVTGKERVKDLLVMEFVLN